MGEGHCNEIVKCPMDGVDRNGNYCGSCHLGFGKDGGYFCKAHYAKHNNICSIFCSRMGCKTPGVVKSKFSEDKCKTCYQWYCEPCRQLPCSAHNPFNNKGVHRRRRRRLIDRLANPCIPERTE